MAIPNLETAAMGHPITRLGISFFPVYLTGNSLPQIAAGRDAGLVAGEMDSPSVPTLSVANPGDWPALIVQGEQFIGGDQNRTLNVSVQVPPREKLDIPVSCLEAGRWPTPMIPGIRATATERW